jgi:hypothetical protein
VLIGREAELERCLVSIDEARPVVLVADAGMGKTTVLTEVAELCPRRSLYGRGFASLSWMAYLPLEAALPEPLPRGDDASIAGAVAGAVGGGVLIVDDLQWADGDTLRILTLLAGKVRLAGAVRTDDPAAKQAIEALVGAGFATLELPPLTTDEAESLLAARQSELRRHEVRSLIERSAGNPLLLEQLSWDGVPSATLRISVEARLQRLEPTARATLGMLALRGRPVQRGAAGPGIDDLLAAGLVTDAADGLAPRHSLLAEVAPSICPPTNAARSTHRLRRTPPIPVRRPSISTSRAIAPPRGGAPC